MKKHWLFRGLYTTQFIINHYKDPYLNNHYNGKYPRDFFSVAQVVVGHVFESFQPRWDAT